jgi:integrase
MAAYLQTLKETFADPGEVLRLRWIDKNDKARIITINHPVKGHNPRQLKVSSKLIAMLNALPKKSKLIFPTTYQSMRTCFGLVRKRAAQTLQNPRLLEISFTTFRHWGGTMIAHYSHGNVLTVKKLLGHKRIENTMKYIHMVHFKDDEFEVATATTVEEIKQLVAVGFEKIDEMKGIHVFRRPKRFAGYT